MTRETIVWTVIMVLGGLGLLYRATMTEQGMAKEYVKPAQDASKEPGERVRYVSATVREFKAGNAGVRFSLPRTVGVWLSALFTLAVFSFLYRDNPFYKLTEAIFVGTSAAYWMVIGFWSTIVPNLFGKLWPEPTRHFIPDLHVAPEPLHQIHYVPLVLSLMLFCRLIPGIGWLSRWPLAFVVGATAGLKLMAFLQADFFQQITNTMLPLVVVQPEGIDYFRSIKNILIVAGVFAGLVYFLFTVEHRGVLSGVARCGIWVMMITFGAAFGYTVMGRIALLAARIEFLLDDWLWIIDPLRHRAVGP